MNLLTEIQQSKPFRSLEEELLVSLQLTADRAGWLAAELMKEHGLSRTQYNALRILRGAGEKGLACSEMGERMIERDPDITRLLDRMEKRGLIQRARDQKDRRVIMARITKSGLEALRALDRPLEDLIHKALGGLGEKKLKLLLQLLQAVRCSVAALPSSEITRRNL
ncbi:MAG: MarR family transcriptional regulator [Acidobacteria bacterium]|nr:MarR family transcriptional regulator [Acidobacteriota bacterium]